MKSSNQDNAEGKLHQAKGAIKKGAARVTNDPNLYAEGDDESVAGKIQEKVGQIKKVFGK